MKKYLLVLLECCLLTSIAGVGIAEGDTDVMLKNDQSNPNSGISQLPTYTATTTSPAILDSIIQANMEAYGIPGVAALVFKDTSIVWTGTYGYANIEKGIEVADTTIFLQSWISRLFVATAAMQLWENGMLDLDAGINASIPFSVINPYHPDSIITMRMLLAHASSIDISTQNPDVVYGHDSPLQLGPYLESYLDPSGSHYSSYNYSGYAPGTHKKFDNFAFALAGHIVELISGISFAEYCQDSIFSPLGILETAWFLSELDTNNIAVQYLYSGGVYTPLGFAGSPNYPEEQLRTSSLNLARFMMTFLQYGELNGVRILDSATVVEMRTEQFPDATGEDNFDLFKQGIGWHEVHLESGLFGQKGLTYGCNNWLYVDVDENIGFIELTNRYQCQGQYNILVALHEFAHDLDMDGIVAGLDNCLGEYNPDQYDSDNDGCGDACDVCEGFDDSVDSDSDGVPDGCDKCPGHGDNVDLDEDTIPDSCDNCLSAYNPGQEDNNPADIYGNACCCGAYSDMPPGVWPPGYTGNTNCSTDGKRTLSDISRLIDAVYVSKEPLCCPASGNTNGSWDDGGCKITLSDITKLIDAIYVSRNLAEPCLSGCDQ